MPDCGRRCKAEIADAAVIIVGQRVATIADADTILVLEDGADRRRWHPRGAAWRLPDLRRDRGLAAERRGGGGSMSATKSVDHRRSDGGHPASAERARSTPPSNAGTARSADPARWRSRSTSGPRSERWSATSDPERLIMIAVIVLAVIGIVMSVFGPKILGRATDVIFTGVVGKQLPRRRDQGAGRREPAGPGPGHVRRHGPATGCDARASGSTSPCWPRSCCWLSRCTRSPVLFLWLQGYLLNGAVQRSIYRMREEVEAKLNRLPLSTSTSCRAARC